MLSLPAEEWPRHYVRFSEGSLALDAKTRARKPGSANTCYLSAPMIGRTINSLTSDRSSATLVVLDSQCSVGGPTTHPIALYVNLTYQLSYGPTTAQRLRSG